MTTNSSGKLELRESETASTLLTETVVGSHRFSVTRYSHTKGIGIGNYVTSASFVVGGYDWVILYYPDGKNNKDYLDFGVRLGITSTAKEVKARFNFTMLDQIGGLSSTIHYTSNITTFGSNIGGWRWTCVNFVERNIFETSKYLKNDCFTIMCTITVVKQFCTPVLTKPEPIMVPASNLDEHLCCLLETGKGTDVTFEVKNEFFRAHKWLLAARSPVFHAQFFGLMSEEEGKNIKLNNIEPEVFKVLLRFIYSDSLPEFEEGEDTFMYQHLLVAADRYDVGRLKIICENKLSQNIAVTNLATLLTLAEQHNCYRLKASCLEFISTPKILVEIMKTDGFTHMTQSCPSILYELEKNMSNHNRFSICCSKHVLWAIFMFLHLVLFSFFLFKRCAIRVVGLS